MHRTISRLLTILAVVILGSFVPTALALGGLLGGLVDTVEDVLQVDEPDSSVQEQPADEQVDDVDAVVEDDLEDVSVDEPVEEITNTTESETADETLDYETEEVIDVDDELLELDGDDKYIRVENELLESVADSAGLDTLGDAAYTLQEDVVHGSVTKVTGKKIDHFYAWVCIGEVCLPVDPFTFSN